MGHAAADWAEALPGREALLVFYSGIAKATKGFVAFESTVE